MAEGECEYCGSPGTRRAGEEDGLREDCFACKNCWNLLKRPETAIPLLRGHLALGMRGVVDEGVAKKMIGAFVETVAGERPRGKPS